MARTPLASSLRQLYLDQARRDGPAPSRRDFLKIASASAAAGLITLPEPIFGRAAPRIAIVGGGIAGLNAALTLHDAGFATTVYEASNRTGGRMFSDRTTWANGQVTEHGGELIDTAHKTIIQLAKRFHISIVDLQAAEPNHSTETYFFDGRYYTLAQANADFNPVFKAVKKDANAAGFPTTYLSSTPAARDLDAMTVAEWIDARVPGGRGSAMGQLLDVAYNIEYGADTTAQSSLNLIYLLAFQSPGNFNLFGQSNERFHMEGGNDQLPAAIANALPAGTVQLGTALTSIALRPDGTWGLGLKRGNTTSTAIADRVVLALPFSVLRTLDYSQAGFSTVKRMAIEELGYGTNSKLQLQFHSRLWNQSGPWGISNGTSYADTGYQNTWDVTRAQSSASGILVDYTGGTIGAAFAGKNSQTVAPAFLSQIEPVFPGITAQWNGRATLDAWISNPYSLGSYAYWKVGQYTAFAGAERERSGTCHFAGEHCSINFQGYMEGGAEEGQRAAKEILADLRAGAALRPNR